MADWKVFRSGDYTNGWSREYPWVALLVHRKFGLFRTWREAYEFADREARRDAPEFRCRVKL